MASPRGMFNFKASSSGDMSGCAFKITSRVYALCVGYMTFALTVSTKICQSFSAETSCVVIKHQHKPLCVAKLYVYRTQRADFRVRGQKGSKKFPRKSPARCRGRLLFHVLLFAVLLVLFLGVVDLLVFWALVFAFLGFNRFRDAFLFQTITSSSETFRNPLSLKALRLCCCTTPTIVCSLWLRKFNSSRGDRLIGGCFESGCLSWSQKHQS